MIEKSYGIIPVKESTVYIVRHRQGEYWGFPKGHHVIGETPLETAIRELKEETSLDPVDINESRPYLESYTFRRDGEEITKTVLYFVASVEGEAKVNMEDVIEGKWVSFAELESALTFDGNKRIANEIRKQYESSSC